MKKKRIVGYEFGVISILLIYLISHFVLSINTFLDIILVSGLSVFISINTTIFVISGNEIEIFSFPFVKGDKFDSTTTKINVIEHIGIGAIHKIIFMDNVRKIKYRLFTSSFFLQKIKKELIQHSFSLQSNLFESN